MASLRDRIARAVAPEYDAELAALREELRELHSKRQSWINKSAAWDLAYEQMPYIFSRPDFSGRLQELNTDAYAFYQSLQGWETLGSLGTVVGVGEAERKQAVEVSRFGYRQLILIQRMTSLWTDFAFSSKPAILIDDEQAQEDFNHFWQSDANRCVLAQSRLPLLSDQVLVDGEIFPVFFINRLTGEVTVRTVTTDQVGTIVRPDGDDVSTLGYVRTSINGSGAQVIRAYRDWAADAKDLRAALIASKLEPGVWADEEMRATDVVMQHIWYTGLDRRGWPAFHKGVWWARKYQDFMGWRLTLARSVATFWEDIQTKGGSRDVKSIISALQSAYATGGDSETNPAAPVGSPFVHNEAVSRNRLPLGTGAGDAEIDGMTVLSYAGLAAGIPPHWLGRPDMMQNRATARELLLPVMRQWERYQSMWEDVFREWARIVLKAAQTYPAGQNKRYGKAIEEMTIEVNMPTALSSAEFPELIEAITSLASGEVIRKQEATRIALGLPELGIEDPDEIYAAMYPVTTEQGGPGEKGSGVGGQGAGGTPEDADKLAGQEDEEPEQTAEVSETRLSAAAERALVEAAIRRITEDVS